MDGAQGPAGMDGAQGPAGMDGAQGPQGPAGTDTLDLLGCTTDQIARVNAAGEWECSSDITTLEGQNLDSRVSGLEERLNAVLSLLLRTVFVTSETFTGDLVTEAELLTGTVAASGLEAGDLICQKLADDAELGGTYKAWLADSSGSPSTRFVRSTVPYVRTDFVKVADDWNDLVDCGNPSCLQAPINVDEFGFTQSGVPAFSNVLPDGTTWFPRPCDSWTFVGDFALGQPFIARVGVKSNTDLTWTRFGSGFCASSFPLYCFGQ